MTFDTSAGTGSCMDIDKWNVTDLVNPSNSGTYPYNHPFITGMTSINEWVAFFFVLNDSAGNFVDAYQVGNPSIASNAGFLVNSYQTGTNTNTDAEWYTITTSSGNITYLSIYPYKKAETGLRFYFYLQF